MRTGLLLLGMLATSCVRLTPSKFTDMDESPTWVSTDRGATWTRAGTPAAEELLGSEGR